MVNSLRFFDSAATTPCGTAAVSRWVQSQERSYGNPSSAHRLGREAALEVAEARTFFGEAFGVSPDQVIFTASGSESDNLAVIGGALAAKSGRVVVSTTEHPAVRAAAISLRDFGFEVALAPVNKAGSVDVSSIDQTVTKDTVVLSIMRVNNIVGSINDVDLLATRAKAIAPNVLVHCDAVQAFGKVDVPAHGSAVDCLSISAHKIHGPKGIGALILLNRDLLTKKRIRPLIWGGGQEQGLRAGTTNAGLIAAFAEAAQEALNSRHTYLVHCKTLSDRLLHQLAHHGLRREMDFWVNSPDSGAPYILNLSFEGAPSTLMSKLLEDEGCFVSTGSACSSQKPERDATLLAMGFPTARIDNALRISFSTHNSVEDVDILADSILKSLRTLHTLFKKPA